MAQVKARIRPCAKPCIYFQVALYLPSNTHKLSLSLYISLPLSASPPPPLSQAPTSSDTFKRKHLFSYGQPRRKVKKHASRPPFTHKPSHTVLPI